MKRINEFAAEATCVVGVDGRGRFIFGDNTGWEEEA